MCSAEKTKNWSRCKLAEIILSLESGKRPKGGVSQFTEGVPSLGGEHLDSNGGFRLDKIRFVPSEFAEGMSKGIIETNDILVVKDGATTGRVSYVNSSFSYSKAVINEHLFSIKLPETLCAKWIFYQLWAQSGKEQILEDFRGAAQGGISKSFIDKIEIHLPPLNEQKRIVAKIEELFSELDKGIENLKTARAQLKIYRQAVLKHAFEGKLTAQWREDNKDNLETADQLLDRIKTEREQQTKANSVKRQKNPRDFQDEDFSWLSQLPDGWTWNRLGWVTCGVEYGTSAKSAETGKMPVLRMGNIQNAKFDWNDLVFTSNPDEIKKYTLKAGDVLFNRTNSPELVGKTAVYRGEQPALFAGYLIRVNQIKSIVNSQFLNLFLNSHVAKQYGNRVKTDGVNQSNINGQKLINYPFPYCSLEEQKIIVEILNEKISQIDQMEAEINVQLQKAEVLRQSILKQAFSGRLVAQDPNDEPASVLLERIRAEKEENKKSKKGRAA